MLPKVIHRDGFEIGWKEEGNTWRWWVARIDSRKVEARGEASSEAEAKSFGIGAWVLVSERDDICKGIDGV